MILLAFRGQMVRVFFTGCPVKNESEGFAPQKNPHFSCPKNPWDVIGCQVATCFEALKRGVMNGRSGVSIGVRTVKILRVGKKVQGRKGKET